MIKLKSGVEIGNGLKPFIIAEVGSNWRDFEDCKNSIRQAKLAGADAVKFQLFNYLSLYGYTEGLDRLNSGSSTTVYAVNYSGLNGVCPYLDPEWLPKLKEVADSAGIEFMVTAFSPELYDVVNPLVNVHKVASAEMSHIRILEKLRSLGKPVIMSTGAHGPDDIGYALDVLGPTPTVLMYCVAAYPARDVELATITALQALYDRPIGYSDHTTDIRVIPRAAIEKGARVLEKHFTVIPEVDTPDRGHSLDVDQFKLMVQSIKGKTVFAWGSGEENEMRLRHNRRLIASVDIPFGAELIEGRNFGIYRSLRHDMRGLSPFAINQVQGRSATREIKAGEAIGPGDFA